MSERMPLSHWDKLRVDVRNADGTDRDMIGVIVQEMGQCNDPARWDALRRELLHVAFRGKNQWITPTLGLVYQPRLCLEAWTGWSWPEPPFPPLEFTPEDIETQRRGSARANYRKWCAEQRTHWDKQVSVLCSAFPAVRFSYISALGGASVSWDVHPVYCSVHFTSVGSSLNEFRVQSYIGGRAVYDATGDDPVKMFPAARGAVLSLLGDLANQVHGIT